jgi:hypothetical protein
MDVRVLNDKDYDVLCEWWKWWRFSPPPKDMLPSNGLGGVMVQKDGVDVCAGFIYKTDSFTCLIEYVVSNPLYKNEDRKKCIEYLINVLTGIGKNYGYKYAFATMKNPTMIKSYESCGYKKGSTDCTELIKVI